jgi:hypothetical protein
MTAACGLQFGELAAAGGQRRLVRRHDAAEEVASLAQQDNRAVGVAQHAGAAGLGVQRDGEVGMAGAQDGTLDLVTLTVTRATTAGPPAAQVADALAGRAPIPAVLGDLPASSRAALSRMADFFNTPTGHSPS